MFVLVDNFIMFLDFLSGNCSYTSQIIACDSINIITFKLCVKVFIEVIKSHSPLNNIGILSYFTNFHTSFICFVINFTDDFFQKILEGHQTSHTTIFIKQNGHLIIGVTKGCQEVINENCFWNKEGVIHDAAKLNILKTKLITRLKEVFSMDYTDNFILIIFVDRDTREALF